MSLIITDDGGRQECVVMVAGVCNAGEPGAFKSQGVGAGAAVTWPAKWLRRILCPCVVAVHVLPID